MAKFHAGVSAICDLMARHSGIPTSELTQYLYVHYEDRAVQHLLSMACGLRLFLDESGTTLDMEVRAHRASIESALERTSLGTA